MGIRFVGFLLNHARPASALARKEDSDKSLVVVVAPLESMSTLGAVEVRASARGFVGGARDATAVAGGLINPDIVGCLGSAGATWAGSRVKMRCGLV